jgi:hypothetical protein
MVQDNLAVFSFIFRKIHPLSSPGFFTAENKVCALMSQRIQLTLKSQFPLHYNAAFKSVFLNCLVLKNALWGKSSVGKVFIFFGFRQYRRRNKW